VLHHRHIEVVEIGTHSLCQKIFASQKGGPHKFGGLVRPNRSNVPKAQPCVHCFELVESGMLCQKELLSSGVIEHCLCIIWFLTYLTWLSGIQWCQ